MKNCAGVKEPSEFDTRHGFAVGANLKKAGCSYSFDRDLRNRYGEPCSLLKDRGFKVTGSDNNPYPPMSRQIEKLGIPLKAGYARANLNPRPDLVIVGNVISAGNEETQEVMAQKIPYTSLRRLKMKAVPE